MASNKRLLASGIEIASKRQKKVMSISEKLNVLDKLNSGASASAVGRHFGINESTVRSIKRNEEKIRESVANSAPLNAKTISVVRDKAIEKMEKVWIEDQMQKNIPLCGSIIRSEAKKLYDGFKAQTSGDGRPSMEFNASKGWFEKFKNRQSLQNIKLHADSDESSSLDTETNTLFETDFSNANKYYQPELEETTNISEGIALTPSTSAQKFEEKNSAIENSYSNYSSRQFPSKYSEYFKTQMKAGLKTATCILCEDTSTEIKMKGSNTKGLIYHLAKKHQNEYKHFFKSKGDTRRVQRNVPEAQEPVTDMFKKQTAEKDSSKKSTTADSENYQLKWNSFSSHLHSCVALALNSETFADVLLYTMDGHQISAHRFVLSACSQYLHQILTAQQMISAALPVIIVLPPEINYKTMKTLIQYMYSGEATFSKDTLQSVLRGGDLLQIKGLWQSKEGKHHGKNIVTLQEQCNTQTQVPKSVSDDASLQENNVSTKAELSGSRQKEGNKYERAPVSKIATTADIPPDRYAEVTLEDKNLTILGADKTRLEESSERYASFEDNPSTVGRVQFTVVKEEPIDWRSEMEMAEESTTYHSETIIKSEVDVDNQRKKGEERGFLMCEVCAETFICPDEWLQHIQSHSVLPHPEEQTHCVSNVNLHFVNKK